MNLNELYGFQPSSPASIGGASPFMLPPQPLPWNPQTGEYWNQDVPAPLEWLTPGMEGHPFEVKQPLAQQNAPARPISDQLPLGLGWLTGANQEYMGRKWDQMQNLSWSDKLFGALDIATKSATGSDVNEILGAPMVAETAKTLGKGVAPIYDLSYYSLKLFENVFERATDTEINIAGAKFGDVIGESHRQMVANGQLDEMVYIPGAMKAADEGDWGQFFSLFGKGLTDPQMYGEVFEEFGGQLAMMVAGGVQWGAKGLYGMSFLQNMAPEIEHSLAEGKNIDHAFVDSFMKSSLIAGADAATMRLADVSLAKSMFADVLAKSIVGATGGAGSLWLGREAMNESVSAGELALEFGLGALFETPAILAAGGQFARSSDFGNTLAAKMEDYTLMTRAPQTQETKLTNVQTYLELLNRGMEIERDIYSGNAQTLWNFGWEGEGIDAALSDAWGIREPDQQQWYATDQGQRFANPDGAFTTPEGVKVKAKFGLPNEPGLMKEPQLGTIAFENGQAPFDTNVVAVQSSALGPIQAIMQGMQQGQQFDRLTGLNALKLLDSNSVEMFSDLDGNRDLYAYVDRLNLSIDAKGRPRPDAPQLLGQTLKPGQVVVALGDQNIGAKLAAVQAQLKSGTLDELGRMKAEAEVEALGRREALLMGPWRQIQKDLGKLMTAVDPKAAVVLTDRVMPGMQRDLPGVSVVRQFSEQGKTTRYVVGINPAAFVSKGGEPGLRNPMIDFDAIAQHTARALGRNAIGKLYRDLPQAKQNALTVAYRGYIKGVMENSGRMAESMLETYGPTTPGVADQPLMFTDFVVANMVDTPQVTKLLGPLAAEAGATIPQLKNWIRADQRIAAEKSLVSSGGRTQTLLEPVEPSQLWRELRNNTDESLDAVPLEKMYALAQDKNLPIDERRALATVLRSFNLDNVQGDARKTSVELSKTPRIFQEVPYDSLAAAFDQALVFERARGEALKDASILGKLFQSEKRARKKDATNAEREIASLIGSYVDDSFSFRVGEVIEKFGLKGDKVTGALQSWLDAGQYGDRYGDYAAPIRRAVSANSEGRAFAHKILSNTDDIAREYLNLSIVEQKRIREWWDYESRFSHIREKFRKSEFDPAMESDMRRSGMTQEQIDAIKHEADTPQYVADMFKLTPEAVAVGTKMRARFSENINIWEQLQYRLLNEQQARNEITEAAAAEEIAKIKKQAKQLRKHPYMPALRFGDYHLVVKVKDGAQVDFEGEAFTEGSVLREAFETPKARDYALAEYMRQFGEANVTTHRINKQTNFDPNTFTGLPMTFFKELEGVGGNDKLKQRYPELSGFNDAQIAAIKDLVYAYAPDTSYRKRMMSKSYVRGESQDLLRSFAQANAQFANYAKRMYYGAQMRRAIEDLDAEIEMRELNTPIQVEMADATTGQLRVAPDSLSGQNARLRVVHQYLQQTMDTLNQPSSRAVSYMKQAINLNFFLGSVKTWVVQTAQYMQMWADLAGKFGPTKAGKLIGGAQRDVLTSVVGGKGLSQVEMDMLQQLTKEGRISSTYVQELVDLSNFETPAARFNPQAKTYTGEVVDKVGQGIRAVKNKGMAPLNAVEQTLRRAQAVAAMRGAMDQGITNPKQLHKVAVDAIEWGNYMWGRENRSLQMNKRESLNVVLAFWSIVQKSLYTATRKKRGNGAYFMLATLATGGLLGFPGAEDAIDSADTAVNLWNRATGDNYKPPSDLRNSIATGLFDLGLDPAPLMKGISGNLMGADVHASTTLGRAIPLNLTQFMRDVSMPGTNTWESLTRSISGPAGAAIRGVVEGRPVQGVVNMTKYGPSAARDTVSLIGNMLETDPTLRTRYEELWIKNKYGKEVYALTTPGEKWLMAMNARPAEYVARQEFNWARVEREQYWDYSKSKLYEQFAEVVKDGFENYDAFVENLNEYNAVAPLWVKIDGKKLTNAYRRRERADMQRDTLSGKLPPGTDLMQVYPELRGLYSTLDEVDMTNVK